MAVDKITVDKTTVDKITVDKITWDRVGRVTEPGRYMYTFGWLTITAGDLEIWKLYPQAAFTLLAQPGGPDATLGEEFHLGAFDVAPGAPPPFTTH
ncbi:hypothetical protein ML401_16975 [Bradyrhizobium sp. 62B]|uniref:hypothetical protein n=1 Tax=unclassified Bradyrhizobium TaxID=2631580 RepID=UPI0018888117|nr:hypothetical protein [Bradyrhizobium sp. CCBAU 53351]QOZ77236.1 hypothetical protein XH83_18340 [Bradyrhizobium sp. CCBAU 53351]WIW49702.1 hypothetical protein ML401_16975 [Bradyrhizobium sp. 62B]